MDRPRLVENRLVVAVGVGVGTALLFLAVRQLSWADIVRVLATVHLLPWLLFGVLSYLAGHLLRGMRTRLLVSPEAGLTLTTSTNVVVVGYAVNNILPARLGEFARAGMLAARTGLPVAQTLTVTLLERVLDGWMLLLLLGLASVSAPVEGWIRDVAAAAGLVFFAASLALVLVLLTPAFVLKIASQVGSRFSEKWHNRAIGFALAVTGGLALLRRPRSAARVILLSLGVWLLEAGLFLFLLPAFGVAPRPWLALLAMAVTNLGILFPSTPGFIGPFHYFCMRTLAQAGVAEATALSYAVIVHAAFFVPVTLWGIAAILWYEVEIGTALALARSARRLFTPTAP